MKFGTKIPLLSLGYPDLAQCLHNCSRFTYCMEPTHLASKKKTESNHQSAPSMFKPCTLQSYSSHRQVLNHLNHKGIHMCMLIEKPSSVPLGTKPATGFVKLWLNLYLMFGCMVLYMLYVDSKSNQ